MARETIVSVGKIVNTGNAALEAEVSGVITDLRGRGGALLQSVLPEIEALERSDKNWNFVCERFDALFRDLDPSKQQLFGRIRGLRSAMVRAVTLEADVKRCTLLEEALALIAERVSLEDYPTAHLARSALRNAHDFAAVVKVLSHPVFREVRFTNSVLLAVLEKRPAWRDICNLLRHPQLGDIIPNQELLSALAHAAEDSDQMLTLLEQRFPSAQVGPAVQEKLFGKAKDGFAAMRVEKLGAQC